MERLIRQKGRVIHTQWRNFTFRLLVTPAGLFDLAQESVPADLTLVVTEESPFAIAQAVVQGNKPDVRIEGDVQLAAEVNWLADHVRWDLEEDLSRIVGDAPAHTIVQSGRAIFDALRSFTGKKTSTTDSATPGSSA